MASPSKPPRMQWTSEADQTLLLTMMKTHAIKIDYAAIAAEWPDQDVKPTPRALKERIAKIQEMAKSRSAGTQTPQKQKRATKTTSNKPENKRATKRKRVPVDMSEEDDDATGEAEASPTNDKIKESDSDYESDVDVGSLV